MKRVLKWHVPVDGQDHRKTHIGSTVAGVFVWHLYEVSE